MRPWESDDAIAQQVAHAAQHAWDTLPELVAAELRKGKSTTARWFLDRATPEQREWMRARLAELKSRG